MLSRSLEALLDTQDLETWKLSSALMVEKLPSFFSYRAVAGKNATKTLSSFFSFFFSFLAFFLKVSVFPSQVCKLRSRFLLGSVSWHTSSIIGSKNLAMLSNWQITNRIRD